MNNCAHKARFNKAGGKEFTANDKGYYRDQDLTHTFEVDLEGTENFFDVTAMNQFKTDGDNG